MKRFILAISAVAVLLLGLEKVGLYRFVPGGDTGFAYQRLASGSGYSLHHANETGNLTAWVRLIVQSSGTMTPNLIPLGWRGDPLVIAASPLGSGRFEISISKEPNPPRGTPFVWGPGLALQIVENAGTRFEIQEWAVYPSDQAADNTALASRRRIWTMISWVMLPLALIGTVLTVVKEKETGESVTARALIGAVVSDVAGNDDAETGKLRTFLRKVLLEDVPVDQALTQVGLPDLGTWPSKRDRIRFFNRAKGLFQGRVDGVLAELIRYRQRLTDPE